LTVNPALINSTGFDIKQANDNRSGHEDVAYQFRNPSSPQYAYHLAAIQYRIANKPGGAKQSLLNYVEYYELYISSRKFCRKRRTLLGKPVQRRAGAPRSESVITFENRFNSMQKIED